MQTIKIGGKEFTLDEIRVLEKAGVLNVGAKHDTSSATPNSVPLNGPLPGSSTQYGIFSGAGARPGVWNATSRVRSISRILPMYKSLNQNELIDVATGVTAGSGNNVTGACTVGPKPGSLKAAQITAAFGIIHISTKIFDITQAGMRKNRADIDREVFNNAAANNPWLPQVPGIDGMDVFTSALRAELYALGVELERNVSQVHFLGVAGTENNTYRGVAKQWNGLDSLIKTGWTDAVSGLTVERLDAAVYSFNAAITGTDANGNSIVKVLSDAWYMHRDWLSTLGIDAVFGFTMRPDYFRALAEVWACSYAISRCSDGAAGTPLLRDAERTRSLFDAMIQGEYLLIDGEQVPVVLDDSIARETLGDGHYKSDIYGIALTGNGRPVVYGEYFDMGNPQATELETFMNSVGGDMRVINDGMYRVFRRVTGGCLEFDFFARPRLITDAPFMHFRVDDGRYYASSYRLNDPIPGFSGYRNGGVTYRT